MHSAPHEILLHSTLVTSQYLLNVFKFVLIYLGSVAILLLPPSPHKNKCKLFYLQIQNKDDVYCLYVISFGMKRRKCVGKFQIAQKIHALRMSEVKLYFLIT